MYDCTWNLAPIINLKLNIKTGNLKLKLEPRMVGECDLVAPLLLLLVLLVQPSDSYRDYGFPFSKLIKTF